MQKKVLVLGGYGNFGKRICETLSAIPNIIILIGGRNAKKAAALCEYLRPSAQASLDVIAIDIDAADFSQQLQNLSPFLVIHTCGPFQGQNYRVPLACIAAGSHYIDLADDRRFVCDVASLDAAARNAGVAVVSGASSVPGLSSCVVEHFAPQFSTLSEIDIAIAPGNKAERGEATVKAILSYTGHPLKVWKEGRWQTIYGWMSPRRLNFGGVVRKRWLANVDVPDLELFPARYNGLRSANFQAGLELSVLHWGMVAMAWFAKHRWIKNWAIYTPLIVKSSHWFDRFGSDVGGMQIHLRGLDHHQRSQHLVWTLYAENGVGPYIPTLSSIILAQQLLEGSIAPGARPCVGLFSLEKFNAVAQAWNLYHTTEINGSEKHDG